MSQTGSAPRLSRRVVLRSALVLGGAVAGGSLLAACQGATPAPAAKPTEAPKPAAPAAPAASPVAAAPAAASPAAAPPAAAASPAAAAPAVAPATDWPKQPVTLVVPWAAGGDTDVPMRVIGEYVGRELGQPVVVQNVAGGSGTAGTRQARGARPDGYTLLSIHEHMSINQHTGVVDYGVRDFDPIALIVTSPVYLATEASNPWGDLKSLIEDAKRRPEEITWGMTFGSTSQMFAFLFMNKTGTKFKGVGYDGTAQRMTALLGKQIELGQTPLSTTVEQLKAGKVKVLGYAWDKREERTKDIATFKEQGVDMSWGESRGWVAPKGTPAPIIARVQEAIQKAIANPELKQKIEGEQGSLLTYVQGQQYLERLLKSDEELKKVIAETGMKSG